MNLSSDLLLDDILNRSLRLESPMNFRIPLDLENISQLSCNILSDVKNEKDLESGSLLLAGQIINDKPIDISRTDDILNSIDKTKMIQNEKLSFADKCTEALKTSISESVEKSSQKFDISSDNFIFANLTNQMKEKEVSLHRFICRAESASISRFGSSQSEENQKEKMVLSTQASSYNSNVFLTDFVHSIEHIIRSQSSQDVKNSLADTYSIIDCISREETPIHGSFRYFAKLFYRTIENEVNKNHINANRGGEIGHIPTIKAYVRLQNYPFGYSNWAVIYFSLLCNVQEELFHFIDENRKVFSDSLKSALEMYFQHLPLTKPVADALEKYHARDTTMKLIDPFKTIVLAILTKKHIIPESENMIGSFEEWLWVRMQFINDDEFDGQSSDGLRQLQEELKDYNPKDRANPFLRGQLYLLINQYQKAAEWFLSCNVHVNHCLHILISMNMANLIDDHCLIKPLLIYAKDIYRANPEAAVRYLTLIHERDLRIDTIAKFVVEVNDGESIFTSSDGTIAPLSMHVAPDEQHEIIQKAAQLAEYRDMHLKAARIYSLIDQYDRVIDLECIELRKYIQGFLDDSVLREPLRVYNEILLNNSSVSMKRLDAMRILLSFARASLFARRGEYSDAIREIERSEFLPTTIAQTQAFREAVTANAELRKALPEMIMVAIKSYAEIFAENSQNKKGLAMSKDKEKAEAILELTSSIDIPNYATKQLLDYSLKFQ